MGTWELHATFTYLHSCNYRYFLLYYDIFLNYKNKNISYTGINNQTITTTNNINDINEIINKVNK